MKKTDEALLWRAMNDRSFSAYLLHVHHTAHEQAVAGEGADQGVVAGLLRSSEFDDLFLAVIEEFAGPEDGHRDVNREVAESFSWCRSKKA